MKSLDARHYLLSAGAITRVKFTDTEHYAVTREFLNKHETMLEEILNDRV